jgi:guanylate cyclase
MVVQLSLIFVIPALMQYSLGGFLDSGAILMWSFLAPIGSLLFQSVRSAINWLYAFILLVFTMLYLENSALMASPFIDLGTQQVFFVVNLIGIALTVFASTLFFVKQLETAYSRNERLLYSVLPKSVADRLGETNRAFVQNVDSATILFADIVGFTVLSNKLAPNDIVKLLNRIFSTFDQIAEKHGLEKIKTIGDAYMVAGNIPVKLIDHAEHVADMSIEMHKAIHIISKEIKLPLQLRIGIHTGPVAAGVLGQKRMAYDLWGDSVNIASRMESQGIAGYTQISKETARVLSGEFVVEPRGHVQIKGKGDMKVYFLHGRRSESTLNAMAF